MGLFQRLFAKKRPENEKTAENISVSQELLRLRELDAFMRALLNADHFVAKSEYRSKLSEYADLSTVCCSSSSALHIRYEEIQQKYQKNYSRKMKKKQIWFEICK